MRPISVSMLAATLLGLTAHLSAALGAVPRPPRAVDPLRLEGWWADLTSTDPIQALAALRALAGQPESAVHLLKNRLKPVRADRARIDRWIADLDSPHFAARIRASEELELVVDLAAPQLRKALENQPSLELRRRLERVLEVLPPEGDAALPHRVQAARAIALLEQVGSGEARRLLDMLAGGDDASPTRAARAARQRLSEPAAAPSEQQLTADLHGADAGAAARAFLILGRAANVAQPADANEVQELLYLVGQASTTDPLAPRGAVRPRTEVTPQFVQTVRILYRASEKDRFGKAVRAAAAALRAGELDVQLDVQLAAPTPAQRDAFQKRLEAIQRDRIATAMAPLMRAVEDLDEVAADRAGQPAYWQATEAYLRARLLGRIAFLYDYNAVLGQARKDDLPAIDPKVHRGWQLHTRPMFKDRDAEKLAHQARKLAISLASKHAGTPWGAVMGQLEVTLFGLEWQPWEK
jgi:hypothetical protein